jgi:AAA15 family ATPase/GTPase
MINYIYIKNFRSIKELEIFPDNLCALVGPNSAGKTNILKALDLILGEGWATKAKVARELFNNPDDSIEIEIKFREKIRCQDSYNREIEADGIKLTMTLFPLSCEVRLTPGDKYLNEDFKKKCHFIYYNGLGKLDTNMVKFRWKN